MTHGSLFSGIGGFDLASEWVGWENVFHCEWNEFGQKVLNYYWPKAKCYGNIKETDFTEWEGRVDVVSGGFPCQPYSLAGKRKGKEDDRHLWPEMLRAIREIQPRWVVGENVFGLVNWSGGLVFHEVQTDLEAAGYEVWPYVLPACAVNAPHRRDRVWFVAHSKNNSRNDGIGNEGQRTQEIPGKRSNEFIPTPNPHNNGQQRGNSKYEINPSEGGEYALDDTKSVVTSDTKCVRQQGQGDKQQSISKEAYRNWQASWVINDGSWPTQPPVCSRDDGLSPELDGITISKHRKESLMAYGNAIVPQVAYQIFKSINQYEQQHKDAII